MKNSRLFLVFDDRWQGSHGIGRFSREMSNRVQVSFRRSKLPIGKIGASGYFSPGYKPPFLCLCPYIFTIHDLNHIDLDFNSSFLKRLYYKFIIKRAVLHSYRVFTVSGFSKSRIVEWSGCEADKVIVVGNGVDQYFFENKVKINRKKPFF